MKDFAGGYNLPYVTILKLQLVNWTLVGLTAAKFKQCLVCRHYIASVRTA
jgi:hypothetical protein